MSDRKHLEPVENYTNAFLVSLGVTLFFGFWILGALYGLWAVFLTAASLDICIQWLGRRR